MIVIIDYGMGNLRSVVNKLQRLEFDVLVSSKAEEIEKADKLILPGVGFFFKGMENLKSLNLIDILNDKVINRKTPVLGICLGMQLLTKRSEEGNAEGLGWIDAETVKINMNNMFGDLRIPHMGWNSITPVNDSVLISNITSNDRFYFVHSYHVRCKDQKKIVATTQYGIDITSIVQSGNIYGTQFHPEKSHSSGIKLLKNFLEIKNV